MVAAKVRVLYKNYTSIREVAEQTGVSHGYVHQASTVLQYRPDLADEVIAGPMPLNEAYARAQERKAEMESEEGKMER